MLLRNSLAAAAVIAAAGFALPSSAMAFDFPGAQCNLNADQSTLEVVVSNPGSEKYACTMACHYKVAGQRLFQEFKCNFSLSPNSGDKVACSLEGDAPGHFIDVRGAALMCR